MGLPTPAISLFCIIYCLLFLVGLLFPLSNFLFNPSALQECTLSENLGHWTEARHRDHLPLQRHHFRTSCSFDFVQTLTFLQFQLPLWWVPGRGQFLDAEDLQRCSSLRCELPRLCPTAKFANTVPLWLHPHTGDLQGSVCSMAVPPQVSPL